MSFYCPYCGEQLPDGSRFCSGCGSAQRTPQPAPQPEPVPVPVYEPIPAPQPESIPEPIPVVAPMPEPAYQQNSLAQPAPQPQPEPIPEPIPVVAPMPEPAYQQNSLAQPAPQPQPEPIPEPIPVVAPMPEPAYQQNSLAQPAPQPEPEPIPEPIPVVAPMPEPAYQQNSLAQPAPQPEPEPIPEPATEAPPAVEAAPAEKKGFHPIRNLKNSIANEARGGFGRQLLATLVCILMFVFVLTSVVILDVRNATSKAGLKQILDNVQIEEVYASDLGIDSDQEFLLWAIDQAYPEGNAAYSSKKAVRKAVEDSELMDFTVDKASDLLNDLYTGDDDFEITREDIYEQLWANDDLMAEFGIRMDHEFANKLTDWLVDSYKLEDLEADTIRDKAPIVAPVMQYGMSYITAYAILALAVLCFVLLLCIQKGRILSAFNQTGITLIIFSILMLIPTGIAILPGDAWLIICGENYLLNAVTTEVLRMNAMLPLCLLGAGFLLTLIPGLLRSWAKKN